MTVYGEAVIVRSGYASEVLWKVAIKTALKHGRSVTAISETGAIREIPSGGTS